MKEVEKLQLAKVAVNFRGVPVYSNPFRFLGRIADQLQVNPFLRTADKVLPGTTAQVVHELRNDLFNPNVRGMSAGGAIYKQPGSPNGRSTIAHEWFHNAVPLVGRSETLARFYGGYAQPRNVGLLPRLQSGLNSVKSYYRRDIDQYSPIMAWWKQRQAISGRSMPLDNLNRSLSNPVTFRPRNPAAVSNNLAAQRNDMLG
jgi:hypothetical protein